MEDDLIQPEDRVRVTASTRPLSSEQKLPSHTERTNSGPGVASLVISLTAGVVLLVDIIDEPIGLAILFAGILGFAGFGLGIAGLCQKGRKKLFAILGMVISSPAILALVFIFIIFGTHPGN